jgi:hypothetical protein
MLVTTKGRSHPKTTEGTDIAIRGEDLATMIITAPIVKLPQDIKRTTTKETIARTHDIATIAEKTQATIGNFSQGDQGNTTSHQMTCSMGHAICTTHSSTAREYHVMR